MSDAHAGPRASSRIFLHLVARGMERTYRAAAAVKADHPGLEVETWLSSDDALLREAPETLPQVLFILQGDEQEQDGVHVSLTLTEGAMRRRLAARVPGVLSGRPGSMEGPRNLRRIAEDRPTGLSPGRSGRHHGGT